MYRDDLHPQALKAAAEAARHWHPQGTLAEYVAENVVGAYLDALKLEADNGAG